MDEPDLVDDASARAAGEALEPISDRLVDLLHLDEDQETILDSALVEAWLAGLEVGSRGARRHARLRAVPPG